MRKTIAVAIFTNIAMLGFASEATNDIEITDQEITLSSMDNVVVGSRPLTKEQQKEMEQKRLQELQESEEIIQQDELNLSALGIPIRSHYLACITADHLNSTAARYSPYLYHWIDGFPQSNILRLEDGSEWDFEAASDGRIVRSWRKGDTLVISPYITWFWESNYKYIITNKDLGSSIYVNPLIGPIEYGINSTWVCKIDLKNGKLFLTNGQGEKTSWEVVSSDFDLISNWEINDHVIFGEDTSWLSTFSSFDHIIFNVNMNHNVRARLVSPAFYHN